MSQLLVGLDDAATEHRASDFMLCKEVGDCLNHAYPGFLWAIDVTGGMLNIRNLMLSPEWGYSIKVPAIYSISAFKAQALRGGGEILERFGMPRSRFTDAVYADLNTNAAGDPLFQQ